MTDDSACIKLVLVQLLISNERLKTDQLLFQLELDFICLSKQQSWVLDLWEAYWEKPNRPFENRLLIRADVSKNSVTIFCGFLQFVGLKVCLNKAADSPKTLKAFEKTKDFF